MYLEWLTSCCFYSPSFLTLALMLSLLNFLSTPPALRESAPIGCGGKRLTV